MRWTLFSAVMICEEIELAISRALPSTNVITHGAIGGSGLVGRSGLRSLRKRKIDEGI